MSNQRLLSATIKPEVQAINPDGPRKKIHQSIQIKKYQSIKEEPKKQPSGEEPSGEGRWVKPVDSPYVKAEWTPICKAKTTTWEPIANPPKFFSYLEKFEF